MARVLFFTLLAMCLVCLIQAAPGGEQPAPQSNPLQPITDAMAQGWEAVKTAAQNVANDPNVQKGIQDMAKLVAKGADAFKAQAQDAAETVKAQVQSVIPKTE